MSRFILTAQLRLASPANVRQIVNQINRQLSGIAVNINVSNINRVTQQLNQLNRNININARSARNAANEMERLGEAAASTIRRYGAFTIATSSFLKLTSAISSGIDEAIKYDRELIRLSQVTGKTVKQLTGLSDEVTRLSKQFGVSSSQILNVSVTLAQAGLSAEKTKVALEALAKTGVSATFGDINNTTEASIAIMQQFGIQVEDLEKTLSSVNAVSAAFAVESEDIAAAVRRSGAAFSAAGGNLNEFIALFTSVRQTTRESAETIATGFRTIFTRLQRVRTQNFLKDLGIDLRDAENQFVGPFEAIKRLSEALKDIQGTDPRFAQIIEELGGFRQISKVIPLIKEFEVSQKALNVAIRGSNSLTEDAEVSQQALGIQISKVKEEFLELIRTFTNSDIFRGLISETLKFTSALIKMLNAIEPILPALSIIGAARIGSVAGSFTRGFSRRINGFASGGLVPGTGNSDTVPAMLTPGEYVIRKKAVEAIGKSNLARINGYNDGGEIDDIETILSRLPSSTAARIRKLPTEALQRRSAVKESSKLANIAAGQQKTADKLSSSTILQIPSSLGATNRFGSVVINGVSADSVAAKAVGTAINRESPTAGKAILASVGSLDNVVVRGDLSRFKVSDTGSKAVDDIVNRGLSEAIDKFIAPAILPKSLNPKDGVPTSKLIEQSGINAIEGYIFEAIVRRVAGQRSFINSGSKNPSTFDFRGSEIASALFENRDRLANTQYVDAKRTTDDTSILAKSINQLIANGEQPFVKVKGFANGGGVASSDTVPAMLTPGEYVINKKAAQSLGKSALDRLNKADVKGFAIGGAVGAIGRQAGNIIQNPAGLLILSSVVSQFGKISDEAESVISALTQMGLQFALFNSGLKNANESMPFLRNRGVGLLGINRDDVNSGNRRLRRRFLVDEIASGRAANVREARAGARNRLNELTASQERTIGRARAGVAIAGAAASFGGQFLSDRANERISRGEDATNQAGLGGALQSGALGGQVGFLFGGAPGAIIGAAAGAIYGYTTSITEAKKQLDQVRFSEKLNELSRGLENVSKGYVSVDSQLQSVTSTISDTLTRSSSLTGEDRRSLLSEFGQNAGSIESFFTQVAKTSSSFDEFNAKTNGAIEAFSVLANIPYDGLKKQIENEIKTRQIANKFEEASAKLGAAEEARQKRLVSFSSAISRASDSTIRLEKEIALLAAGISDAQIDSKIESLATKIDNLFSGTGDISSISPLLGGLESLPGGKELSQEIKKSSDIIAKLPNAIISARTQQQLGRDFNLEDFFTSQFDDFGPEVVSILGDRLRDILGPENDISKFTKSQLSDLVSQFSKDFEVVKDVLKEYEEKIRQQQNAIVAAYGKYFDAQVNASEQQARITNLIRERSEFFRQANGGRVSLREVADFENNRRNQTFGGSTVGQFVTSRSQAISALSDLEGRVATTPLQGQPALQKEIADQTLKLRKANQGLEDLASSTEILSAIQEKLAEAERNRESSNSLAEVAAFGTREQKQDLQRKIQLTQFAGQFGLEAIPEALRGQVLDLLNQFEDTTLNLPGIGNASDLKKRLVQQTGLPFFGKGETKAEKDLKAQAEEIFNVRKSALEALETGAKDAVSKIGDEVVKRNNEFLNRLESSLINDQINNTQADIDKLLSEIISLKDIKTSLDTIKKAGVDTSSPNRITGTGNLLDERLSLLKNESSLTSKFRDISQVSVGFGQSQDSIVSETAKIASKANITVTPEEIRKAITNSGAQLNDRSFIDNAKIEGSIEKLLSDKITSSLIENRNKLNLNESTLKSNDTLLIDINNIKSLDELVKTINSVSPEKIQNINENIDRLDKEITQKENFISGLKPVGRNSGGTIPGVGSTDTVPAMLTPGEFVLRKAAVDAIGLDNLHRMNAQGYASGGLVEKRARIARALSNQKNPAARALAEQRLSELDSLINKSGSNKPVSALNVSNKAQNKALTLKSIDGMSFSEISQFGNVNRVVKSVSERNARNSLIANRRTTSDNVFDSIRKNQSEIVAQNRSSRNLRLESARAAFEEFRANRKEKDKPGTIRVGGNIVRRQEGGSIGGGSYKLEGASEFNAAVRDFSKSSSALADVLKSFPTNIELTANHKVEVIFNGAEILTGLQPEIQKIAISEAKKAINSMIDAKMPDVGRV